MNPIEKIYLDQELNSRIQLLKEFRNEIIRQTKIMIDIIENSSFSFCSQLSSLIKHYSELILRKKYKKAELQEIKDIFKSEIEGKGFDFRKLQENIKDAFEQIKVLFKADAGKDKIIKKKVFVDGHNGGFNCLDVSIDGKVLVSGSEDGTVRVWDLEKTKQTLCFTKHKSDVYSIALSKDSNKIISGSFDKTVIQWDIKSKSTKIIYKGHTREVLCVSFNTNEKLIISGSGANEIIIWSTTSSHQLNKLSLEDVVWCSLVTNKNFLYVGVGNYLKIFDLNTLSSISSVNCHTLAITSIATSSQEDFIVTCSYDKSIRVWKKGILFTELLGHTQEVTSVSLTSDDKSIISGSCDYTIKVWDIASESLVHSFDFHKEHIYCVKTCKNLIFSASRDSRIGISDISSSSFNTFLCQTPFKSGSECILNNIISYGSLNEVMLFDYESKIEKKLVDGHKGLVQSTCISSKMNFLLSSSTGVSNNLILWDLQRKCKISNLIGHQDSVFCVDVSEDEANAVSGDYLSIVRLWDLNSLQEEFSFEGHCGIVNSVKFSKCKRFVVSAGTDQKVIVWDLRKKIIHARFEGHLQCIWKVGFADNNESIFSADLYDGVKVWSVGDKKLKCEYKDYQEASEWIEKNDDVKDELIRFLF